MAVNLEQLDEFYEFARGQLRGSGDLSLTDLLDLYRMQSRYDHDVRSLRQALHELAIGESGRPFDQFVDEVQFGPHGCSGS